jgi:hypothetical protein
MKNRPEKIFFYKMFFFKIQIWWGYMTKLDFENPKKVYGYHQQGTIISKNITQGYFM